MKLILDYLKDNIKVIGRCALLSIIYVVVFFLYNLHLEPILYGLFLFIIVWVILGIIGFVKYKKKHKVLKDLSEIGVYSLDDIPEGTGLIEEDYKNIIDLVFSEKIECIEMGEREKKDILDYYTLWAHQIKTPIAAIKILMQKEESDENLLLLNELFKIEQYVEMVLNYLRLGSMSQDLVLKEYSLDNIVRQAVRKYARLFIGKRISLQFEDLDAKVLTDEKWLVFVIEQILSNAIKYTNEGGKIAIYMDKEKENTIVIEDNGIGIKAEDLPRVFEKGFTGFNGRSDKKSTGIGLYLCSTVLKRLSHKIEIESEVSKYTRIKINLETINLTEV